MYNIQIAVGRAGRDPETKFMPNGTAISKLSVATENSWKDKASGDWKKQTDWVEIVGFGKEGSVNSIRKGDLVLVVGRSQTRSYDKDGVKQYRTELVADTIKNLSAMERGKPQQEGNEDPWG